MPQAWLKVLRSDLRTSFKFVRNEFAHNVIDISRSRCLSLLERMSELYEVATWFSEDVNSFIHPAGLPIHTSTIKVLRGPVESSQYAPLREPRATAPLWVLDAVN